MCPTFLYVPYTFLYGPDDPSTFTLLAELAIRLLYEGTPCKARTTRTNSVYIPYRLCLAFARTPSGSYTLPCVRNTFSMTFLVAIFEYVSRSCTFLYVPRHTSRKCRKLYQKLVRSYTSGIRSDDVPAGNLYICPQNLYVPIRSGRPLHFRQPG